MGWRAPCELPTNPLSIGPGDLFREVLFLLDMRVMFLGGGCLCTPGSLSAVLPLVLCSTQTYTEALFSSSPGWWTSSSFLPCSFCCWLLPGCLSLLCLFSAPGSSSCMNWPGSYCSLDQGSWITSLEICDHILIWFLGLSMAVCSCKLLIRILAEINVWCRCLSNHLVKNSCILKLSKLCLKSIFKKVNSVCFNFCVLVQCIHQLLWESDLLM